MQDVPAAPSDTAGAVDETMIDDAGRAVLAAEEALDAVHPRYFQEMKAQHTPPRVAATAAAKVLLDIENKRAGADADGMTFGSRHRTRMLAWPSLLRGWTCGPSNPIPSKRLARLLEMETGGAPPRSLPGSCRSGDLCLHPCRGALLRLQQGR